MSIEELVSLGLSDEVLAQEFKREFGFDPKMREGNTPAAMARRIEVFDLLMPRWADPIG